MPTPTARSLIAIVAVATGLAACGTADRVAAGGAGDGRPVVVATTGIWADVVSEVACDGLADIRPIVPPGADPHAFEASLADRGVMESASLVVANGLHLEDGLDDALDAVAGGGTPVIRLAEHVPTIPYTADRRDSADHRDSTGRGDHDGADPHVWFDPTRVSAALTPLAERLVADAGLDPEAVAACVDSYRAELAALDAEVEDLLAVVPPERRLLVTSHDSLGYLADRYGFEVIGTVIPAPSGLAETNPAQLAELADLVAATGVPAIFAEEQHSTDDAEALAARLDGVTLVVLATGALGGSGSGAETYIDLIRSDARLIAGALG